MPVLQKSLKPKKQVNVLIYGKEGSGKSNLAKSFPNPLVMRAETGIFDDSLPYLDVTSYADIYNDLSTLTQVDSIAGWLNEQGYQLTEEIKTFVVDSSTAVEKFMNDAFCKDKGINELQDLGGKKMGGAYVWREAIRPWWDQFIQLLNMVAEKHDVNIVVTAHNKTARVKSAMSEEYSKEDLSLMNPQAINALCEWSDVITFLYTKIALRNVGDQMSKNNIATDIGGRVAGLGSNPNYRSKIRDFGGRINTQEVTEIPYEMNAQSFLTLIDPVLAK